MGNGKDTRGAGTGVREALAEVRARIEAAAVRAAREPGGISLLAVTKTVSPARIREAAEAGQRLFGENRVQEAREKVGAVGAGVVWHMIGHLQRNKARAAVKIFDVVESVDSLELAVHLDRFAREEGKVLKVLLQVKETPEEAKSGVDPGAAPALIEKLAAMPNLALAGLMSIPPWPSEPEDSRPYFAALRGMRDRWDGRHCPAGTLRELSMGMTVDFEVAVEEGATIVRVGSAIFGERPRP